MALKWEYFTRVFHLLHNKRYNFLCVLATVLQSIILSCHVLARIRVVKRQRCVSTTHYIKIMWYVWGGRRQKHTGFWLGNPKKCFEDRGMFERKALKWIFKQTVWQDLD